MNGVRGRHRFMWNLTEELEERRSLLLEVGYDSYCLFTRAGEEEKLSNELNHVYPELLALPFKKTVHVSKNGVKSIKEETVLPGYVFAFVEKGKELSFLRPGMTRFRVLKSEHNPTGVLKGSDRKYAEWVFNSGGIIGMSKALKMNGKVKIVFGPLSSFEGKILEYSSRSRNCRVQLELFGRIINAWFPFEYVDPIKEEHVSLEKIENRQEIEEKETSN